MPGWLLRAAALASLALVATAPSASAEIYGRFKVSVSGSLTHNFQANGDDACEPTGTGSMTVDFRTPRPAKLRVRYDFANESGWIIKGRLPLVGTRANADDTAPLPDSGGDPCTPFDKSGCGSAPFKGRGMLRRVFGTSLGFTPEPFPFPSGPCDDGGIGGWDRGGMGLPLKLPLRTVYGRRKTFALRNRKISRVRPDGSDDYSFETVRRVKITFRRLR